MSPLSSYLHPFTHLSYPTTRLSSPGETLYTKGPLDALYILSCLLFFVFLREFAMRFILGPIAERYVVAPPKALEPPSVPDVPKGRGLGAAKKGEETKEKVVLGEGKGKTRREEKELKNRERDRVRFKEQGWACLYATVYWHYGMVSPVSFLAI